MAVQDAPAPHPDAELIALRPEYHRLRAQYDAFNDKDEDWTDDADLGKPFDDLCMRIVAMPPATTAEGRAFKAIAAMHQMVYVGAGWRRLSVARAEGLSMGKVSKADEREDMEIRMILHRLWWQARQRRIAREHRAGARPEPRSAVPDCPPRVGRRAGK